jgi:hypothetical protein
VLHDGETRNAPVAELAVNTPPAESDLTAISEAELLAGVRRGDASTMTSEAPPAPADIEKRQGLWRIVIGVLAALLLLEMLMASRGWRAVANPIANLPSTGEGS